MNWKAQTASRLDLFTGKLSPYPVGPGGTVEISLPPGGSLLLSSGGTAAPPEPQLQERTLAAGPSVVRRLSPNVLQIDYCDLTLAGNTDRGIYFYNAADKVFKHYGFAEGNPWNTAVQYKTNILDRNKFPADSGFEAAFHFDVDAAVDRSTLQAVVERPDLWQVSVNGKPVKNRPGAWWLDRAFGVYSIGPLVAPGRNTITLVARPMSVHNELEPVYVLGEFGVAAQDRGFKLVAAGGPGSRRLEGAEPAVLFPDRRLLEGGEGGGREIGPHESSAREMEWHGRRGPGEFEAGRHHRMGAVRIRYHGFAHTGSKPGGGGRIRVAQKPAWPASRQD